MFLESVVASAILNAVVCWGSTLRVADTNKQNKLIRRGAGAMGVRLDSLMEVSERRMLHKVKGILDDCDLLDISCHGILALALGTFVYLWNSETRSLVGCLEPSLEQTQSACGSVSSLSWSRDGRTLCLGTLRGDMQLWDVEQTQNLRFLASHLSAVRALSWKQQLLSRLASGSTDGQLHVWDDVTVLGKPHQPLVTMKQPTAVKAVGWCPWMTDVIATGGGWNDGKIRIWDTNSGSCVTSVDTHSQICALRWDDANKGLASGHGLPHHQVIFWDWKPPSLELKFQLSGHSERVLHLALSPDGDKIFSAGADDFLMAWS
ncbi:cell division cycle protein 20 homolog B-like [Neosynchiropus ocellatus]